jgi:hypothetical protein
VKDWRKARVEQQLAFLGDARVRQRAELLRRNYGELYRAAMDRMYVRDVVTSCFDGALETSAPPEAEDAEDKNVADVEAMENRVAMTDRIYASQRIPNLWQINHRKV